MKSILTISVGVLLAFNLSGKPVFKNEKTKVMTLGVFHFEYYNRDIVKTREEDKISVLDNKYQKEIAAIAEAIEEFQPTIIAVEIDPGRQAKMDSLFNAYVKGSYNLGKSEVYQLGFRIAKARGLSGVHCINSWGRHYSTIESIFTDSVRNTRFENYYEQATDSLYGKKRSEQRITSLLERLILLNNSKKIKDDLGAYLQVPFCYEEKEGEFTGVDFETGRWFNRNLRIYRNLQRIPHTANDRILIIYGSGHLNLLNPFLECSREFEFVSPLPYLSRAKRGVKK